MHFFRCGGECHDDVIDLLVLDDAVEIPACAEDAKAGCLASVQRVLVEEPNRRQSQLRALAEPLRNQPPDVAGADDQSALTGFALSPGAALGRDEPDSAREDEGGGEKRTLYHLFGDCGCVGETARERAR